MWRSGLCTVTPAGGTLSPAVTEPGSCGSMMNRERVSSMASSERAGRWEISTYGFLPMRRPLFDAEPGPGPSRLPGSGDCLLRVELDDQLLLDRRVDLR